MSSQPVRLALGVIEGPLLSDSDEQLTTFHHWQTFRNALLADPFVRPDWTQFGLIHLSTTQTNGDTIIASIQIMMALQ